MIKYSSPFKWQLSDYYNVTGQLSLHNVYPHRTPGVE